MVVAAAAADVGEGGAAGATGNRDNLESIGNANDCQVTLDPTSYRIRDAERSYITETIIPPLRK